MKLDVEFYQREDVVGIARELIGKRLCTRIDRKLTRLRITETEAYAGTVDKASHAFGDRRTQRTEPMYAEGGVAYVYLCYGIHHLFNVVTNRKGVPHAVLVRAGEPLTGLQHMLARRKKEKRDKWLLAGPGSLAKAMGITTKDTGIKLTEKRIWIEDDGTVIEPDTIKIGPRIGVDYAEEDAALPYRFRISTRM